MEGVSLFRGGVEYIHPIVSHRSLLENICPLGLSVVYFSLFLGKPPPLWRINI